MWALLLVTLPTQPNAVRLRIWRSLKGLGCAALRDGAYALPSEHVATLDAIAVEVREHGGSASVLALAARDEAQRRAVLALFDRGAAYAQWRAEAQTLAKEFERLGDTEARRRLRGVADSLSALQRIDYYPGTAAEQARSELLALRAALDACFSKGEPPRTPRGALGFDYDGARFSHIGSRVTFEVLAASFGLERDPKLQRIAAAVHYLDVGGIPVAEAPGLESVLAGLRALHMNDDRLLVAAASVFDALYAAPASGGAETAQP